MLEAKSPPLLLFVGALLMASCQSRKHAAEQGAQSGEKFAICKLETMSLVLNSTNMTHFVYGIAANAAAVLLYGSNFAPIKRVETGDGMFFHWVSCAAIWVISVIGNVLLQSPRFYPFVMLGGVIWATGNIAVTTIVKAIGLGLGSLIWASSSMLMGWASSRFGWFGITAVDVSRPILNYCGAALCLLSGLIFFFVRTNVELHPISESLPLLIDRRMNSGSYGPASRESWIDMTGPKTRRFIGCLLAVVSGLLYGSSFVPIYYIKSHSSNRESMYTGASLYGTVSCLMTALAFVLDLDYLFSHCSGIFVASTVYFAIYCAAMKNRPRVYSRVVLPGLLSGTMWSLATYCWCLASNYLSPVISFPLVSAGYSLVAALLGTLLFKEVKGLANCLVLFLASCIVLTGSVLTVVSKL